MAIFIEGTITPAGLIPPFAGEKTTSLVDVIGQVKNQPDGPLDVYIRSYGGSVDEGFAIHDYLVGLGRPVRTIAIEQCASIATVVFLAGSSRIARCELMIHNPWSLVEGDSATVLESGEILNEYEKRLEKFYAEKLDIEVNTVSDLMQAEVCISPEQALALGFANAQDSINQPIALINKSNNQPKQKMKKPFAQRVKDAIVALAGAILNMELTTADGNTLTVEREDGDPQVGDVATPDGSHVMPDGSTIVVTEGVISEITPVSTEPTTEEQLAQANARIAELEASEISAEDRTALNAVKALGGVQALKQLCSTYKPQAREGSQTKTPPATPNFRQQLNNIKNKK